MCDPDKMMVAEKVAHVSELLSAEPRETASAPRASPRGSFPGLRQGVVVVLLCGLACWFWILPRLATGNLPSAVGGASELADVAADDIQAALATMNGSSAFLAQWRQRTRDCNQRLAWVTVARRPDDPPGTVRLQSGSYFSPVFTLPDTPMRVAIPYPAPYETGRGPFAVLVAGGGATIALTPPWHVSTQTGGAAREVTWKPDQSCVRGNG